MIVCISDHNNVKIIPCLGTSQPSPAILVAAGQNHDINFIILSESRIMIFINYWNVSNIVQLNIYFVFCLVIWESIEKWGALRGKVLDLLLDNFL